LRQPHPRPHLPPSYGHKQEATNLVVEWLQTVGAAAGVAPSSARVSTGALGAPESRLELEIAFDSMSDWEAFLARVPAAAHRAWSQRVQGMVVDGSPKWEVFRVVEVPAAGAAGASAAAVAGDSTPTTPSRVDSPLLGGAAAAWATDVPGSSGGGGGSSGSGLVFADKISPEDTALWDLAQRALAGSSGGGSGSGVSSADGEDRPPPAGELALDWKGDPIEWSPGDKAPFKFL
jgi:hypothetical protein